MKAVYPVVMTKVDRDFYPYYIDIPDFNLSLHAENVISGMEEARSRIITQINKLQSADQSIPESNCIIPTTYRSDIITLVDIDTDEQKIEDKKKFFNIFN